VVTHIGRAIAAEELRRRIGRYAEAEHARRGGQRRKQRVAMAGHQRDAGEEEHGREMNDDRAEEGACRFGPFLGQVAAADRHGDEQEGDERRPRRADEDIEVVPALEFVREIHAL
jgi:hypothetical protein